MSTITETRSETFRCCHRLASASQATSFHPVASGELRDAGRPKLNAIGDVWLRRGLNVLLLAGMLHIAMPALLRAQTGLPDAPGRSQSVPQEGVRGSGSIGGLVLDINGGLVAGATVTLTEQGQTEEHVAISGSDGQFAFTNLDAGRFTFTIVAPGLQTFVSSEVVVRAGERHELPRIALPIAATTSDVSVVVTQEQVAQEQVKEEEKQRAFGIFPNFYSSYVWDAAPLTSKQKFNLALHSIADPVGILIIGGVAGVEQQQNIFPGYGQGAKGYAKRFGSAYADDAIGRMIGGAILPTVLHQDPRYFYMGSGSTKTRAIYAIRSAVICKGDNGRWQPNYSGVLGAFAAGGISNFYHEASDRGAGLTIEKGFLDIAGHAAENLVREFILRKITPKVPEYEHGKPE